MAYDSTTKTITKPVNTSDVCSAIGEDKHRIGFLCTHINVNPHSKHKPMRYNTLSELTNGQKISIDWGYHIPIIRELRVMLAQMLYEENNMTVSDTAWNPTTSEQPYVYLHYGWWYRKPQGGESSPYRLGDFNGYKHNTPYFLGVAVNQGNYEISTGFWCELEGEIDIESASDVGTNVEGLSQLYNKVLLVAALKESQPADTSFFGVVKYRTGPAQLPGGLKSYKAVYFSEQDCGKLFYNGTGYYYLYFFLLDRDQLMGTEVDGFKPSNHNFGQSYTGDGQNNMNGDKLGKTITLPIQRLRVHWTKQSYIHTNPYRDLQAYFERGTITMASNGRITITGALCFKNTGSSNVSVNPSNLQVLVTGEHKTIIATFANSGYSPINSGNGTITVKPDGNKYYLFGSASTTATIATFITSTGEGTFNDPVNRYIPSEWNNFGAELFAPYSETFPDGTSDSGYDAVGYGWIGTEANS